MDAIASTQSCGTHSLLRVVMTLHSGGRVPIRPLLRRFLQGKSRAEVLWGRDELKRDEREARAEGETSMKFLFTYNMKAGMKEDSDLILVLSPHELVRVN